MLFVSIFGLAPRVLFLDLPQQTHYLVSVLDRSIEDKGQLRNPLNSHSLAKFFTKEPGSPRQCVDSGGTLLLRAKNANVNLGVAQIRRRIHLGNADHSLQPRILNLPGYQFAYLSANKVVYSLYPSRRHGLRCSLFSVCLYDIAGLKILESLDANAALVSGCNFLDVVLKTP